MVALLKRSRDKIDKIKCQRLEEYTEIIVDHAGSPRNMRSASRFAAVSPSIG